MARMSAVEEMAGMDVLCSDKTGGLRLCHPPPPWEGVELLCAREFVFSGDIVYFLYFLFLPWRGLVNACRVTARLHHA